MGGLENLGNTCFINTLIQCIAVSKYLKDVFANLDPQDHKSLTYQLKDVIAKINNGHTLSPRGLINTIYRNFSTIIEPGHPHDICELWVLLSNAIHSECGVEYKNKDKPEIKDIKDKIKYDTKLHNEFKKSEITKTIQNIQLSSIQCANNLCNHKTINSEVFNTMSIDIPIQSESIELLDCIKIYFITEELSDWKCDNCKETKANRLVRLWHIPNLLIINIKRFTYENGNLSRVNTPVNIPKKMVFYEGSIISNPSKIYNYNLISIGNHLGGGFGGHYHADVNRNNDWFRMDDESIYKIEENDLEKILLNNIAGYILFYELDNN